MLAHGRRACALLALLCVGAHALYGPKDGVRVVDANGFKTEVLDADGVVLVEFFAPWCGHCKNLVPDWKKAAKALKGVVKVVAVDATAEQQLAATYGVQGYPTIKIFGLKKGTPSDYNGGRDAKSIAQAGLKAAQELVNTRLGGGSSGGSKPSQGGGGAGKHAGHEPFMGTHVVTLTKSNFKTKVLESDQPWLVSFYAPWCGHCKRLEPEWKHAAQALGSEFSLGAVDATAEQALAAEYDVKGYPTIKFIYRGLVEDYDGPREAAGIEEYAHAKLEVLGKEPEVRQLVSDAVWRAASGKKNTLLLIAFLPHILDSGAAGRNEYLDTLKQAAKKNRRSPATFMWVEAGQQPGLEAALGGFGGYPAMIAASPSKLRFAQMRDAFDLNHINSFLVGVLTGGIGTTQVSSFGSLDAVDEWDGQDGVPPEEEPLDDLDDVELEGSF